MTPQKSAQDVPERLRFDVEALRRLYALLGVKDEIRGEG